MDKNQEKKPENEKKNEELNTNSDEVVVVEHKSLFGKIVKPGLAVLAAVATGIMGFILGRNVKDDDEEDSEQVEEKTE